MLGIAGNAQTFEQSVTIITKERVALKNVPSKTMSARSVELISNNVKFILPQTIVLGGVKLSDDGMGNDLKAGDGIYTSLDAYEASKQVFKSYAITFDGNTNPAGDLTSKGHVKIKCHVKYFYEIPYVDCDIDISIEW